MSLRKLMQGSLFWKEFISSGVGWEGSPPANKAWLILQGQIYHTTAADTAIYVMDKSSQNVSKFTAIIPAAQATGTYPLFNGLADVRSAQFTPLLVNNTEKFFIANAAGTQGYLLILEFDI